MKAILAAILCIAAVIGQITAPSLDSRQSKLSFALLMAALIIGTYVLRNQSLGPRNNVRGYSARAAPLARSNGEPCLPVHFPVTCDPLLLRQ